jgi:hypothetical protein
MTACSNQQGPARWRYRLAEPVFDAKAFESFKHVPVTSGYDVRASAIV